MKLYPVLRCPEDWFENIFATSSIILSWNWHIMGTGIIIHSIFHLVMGTYGNSETGSALSVKRCSLNPKKLSLPVSMCTIMTCSALASAVFCLRIATEPGGVEIQGWRIVLSNDPARLLWMKRVEVIKWLQMPKKRHALFNGFRGTITDHFDPIDPHTCRDESIEIRFVWTCGIPFNPMFQHIT